MFFLILIDKLLYKYRVLIYIAKNVCEAFRGYTVTSEQQKRLHANLQCNIQH